MTLTAQFNSKAKIDSRKDADSETFGGKNVSRYFSALAFGAKHGRKLEIEIVQVHVPVRAPALRM